MKDKFFHSVMAGIYIALGGMTYLAIPDPVIGAMFFSLGIFLVINYSNMLFTRVVPLSDSTCEYHYLDCAVAWIGNGIGAFIIATAAHFTRFEGKIAERLAGVVETKLNDTPLSLFIMGIFCAIFVSYAVFSVKKKALSSGIQVFLVWLLITAFVFGGYDHIVANFYYLSAYGWAAGFQDAGPVIKVLAAVTLGNVAGGLLFGLIEKKYVGKC